MKDKILHILGEMDDDLGITGAEGLEKIIPIIKEWALEVVGEAKNTRPNTADIEFIEGFNEAKEIIKNRIEEELI